MNKLMKTKRVYRYLILTLLPIVPLVLPSPANTQVQQVGPDRRSASTESSQQSQPAPSQSAQQNGPDDVVRVDTNLVTIPARVVDRDGRCITDLKKEDFQVFEDGVEQDVAFLAPVERSFTILFLLDVSGSMSNRMADLARAADVFVGRLRPDDQLSALAFADFPWVLFRTMKVSELPKGIRLRQRTDQRVALTYDTMIYDAVDDALKRMKKVRGRKAIVLFSDGYGTGMFATAKSNLREAEEQDSLIYTVQFDTLLNKKNNFKRVEEASNYMRDLAQKTGGRHYQVEKISDLGQTFGQIADELRQQYSLGYYPKTKLEVGQQRQVKVKVRQQNLVVLARDSYTVGKDRAKGN
jgi:Ca-activated chloride channel homolog